MNHCTRILFFFLLGTYGVRADTAATEKEQNTILFSITPEKNTNVTLQMQNFANLCELIVKRTNNEMKSASDYEDIQEAIKECYSNPYRKINPEQANAVLGFALLRFVLIMMHEMDTLMVAISTSDILKIEDQESPEAGMWQLYEQRINFVNTILNKNMLQLIYNLNPTELIEEQQKKEGAVLVKLLKKESHDLFAHIKEKLEFIKNSLGKENFIYKKISAPATILYYKLHPKQVKN